MILTPVAHIENDFPTKFGLPRQSGLGPDILSRVVLEKGYGENHIRGIEEFSHLWLVWGFDVPPSCGATVRPPRLGGNERRGVFATRSPFRPNPLGLTVVKLMGIEKTGGAVTLLVAGGDMKSGTPVYDIKPYIPYADCVSGAAGGFADAHAGDRLRVEFPEELKRLVHADKLPALIQALSNDPRPQYIDDPDRVFGFEYAGLDVRFRVRGDELTVVQIENV